MNMNTPATRHMTTSEPSFQSFRNVSACNRCRLRKHRCDQRLPRCEPCEKAGTRCVGYDPLTKREVPRSYVCFLESQVKYLKQLLIDHGIEFKTTMPFDEKEPPRTGAMRHGSSQRQDLSAGRAGTEGRIEQQTNDRPSLKRKLSSHPGSALPPRQLKRVLQLNLILKDLLTESCASYHCDREHVQPSPQSPISTQVKRGISIPHDRYFTPELSDDHASSDSGSGSPESLQLHFEDSSPVLDIPVMSDDFQYKRAYTPKRNFTPNLTSMHQNLVALETKPLVSTRCHNISQGVPVEQSVSAEPKAAQACSGTQFGFTSEADQKQNEQSTDDLLDEFLVGWDEDRLGIC
ncbi:Positive regulator of purine utilization [Penicillium rolfsii]|nr:Positive regulator of purine utilization [Penicillium rolfsii]